MEWFCGLFIGVLGTIVLGALIRRPASSARPARPFRYCPACGEETEERDDECPHCELPLDGRLARDLHRVRVAEREVRSLVDHAQLDRETAEQVLDQLEVRARSLQGLPAKKHGAPPRAKPVAPAPLPAALPVAPPGAGEVVPSAEAPAALPPEPEPVGAEPPGLFSPAAAAAFSEAPAEPAARASRPAREPEPLELGEPRAPAEPPPPKRRLTGFLEEHNILWGELVGGLLIVGCSIALVVTLRQTLEAIPYFRFMLSAAVTLGLFGAGQYTLHRWKLTGTSRGMLVIALLLAPLTLLLLADPFTQGTQGAIDLAVKLGAVAAFVGVVRTGGRDLIGTEHLPGPIDRRWLLSLAVVGAAGTQLLPAVAATPWLPLLCFVVATAATIGGLSWYHPDRRHEPVSEKSGTALLMFTGLAVFALLAAWGLYLVRAQDEVAKRFHLLALPLALAAIPVVEAGVLVLRRVTSSVSLRTLGTAVALTGFLGMTIGLALAWPDPAAVLLVAALAGAFLTFVAFRERLPWMQSGAIPLLAFAAVLGFHGAVGNWPVPAGASANAWLRAQLDSSETGAVLAGFALALALTAELLARRPSRQTASYALGAVVIGVFGLFLVSTHGVARPAVAAFAHGAVAVGLLASNARWKQRAVAHGGLWVALAGTMWALWWLAPRQPALWGFVVAVEAVLLAVGSVALRHTHGPATALLRRAARDVSFAACVLAIVLAATSLTLRSEWHTGTLFALTFAGFALARLTGWPPLTWAGSVAALLGLAHLGLYTLDGKPETLTIEAAILAHATLATLAAVACRRQARVFGDPLRWSARLSSVLAVPLLFLPLGLAYDSALLAVWLGVVWLAFSLLWRERGAFSAFQGALTLAALLVALGWVEHQPWWTTTSLNFRDPRALHAFGIALGALAIAWIIARRALRPLPRARELWCDDPLSLDRFVLAATVGGFLLLNVVAVVPGARAELTPLGYPAPILAPPELAHAFDVGAIYLFLLLGFAVVQSWRMITLERDTDVHVLGIVILYLSLALTWAGSHEIHTATASALRWGLALVFVIGSTAIALRRPLRRLIEARGFPVQPSRWLRGSLLAIFAAAAGAVVLLSAEVADIGLHRWKPSGPAEVSIFALMGTIASNIIPLSLVVFGLGLTAGRERSSGYALSGGLVFVATLTAGYALTVVTAGKPLDGPVQTLLCLIAASSAAVWALAWLGVQWRVPGGVPLTLQTCLGAGVLALVCLVPALRLLTVPGEQFPPAFDPLGQFGWGVLALVSCAGFWHARREWREGIPLVFAFAGLVVGVLVASALREFDPAGEWVSFHALVLTWAAIGFAFFANLNRGEVVKWLLTAIASLLVVCALRAGWHDPWKPWLPAGLSLATALFLGAVALRTRLAGYAAASGLAVNLAAVFVWVAWGPDTLAGFLLANAVGLAAAAAVWTLVRIWQALPEEEAWLGVVDFAPVTALALLALGLLSTLSGGEGHPWALAWGATAAVALASAIGLWDRFAKLSRLALYATGVLAMLLGAATADRPLPVWDTALAPLALAVFALGVAALSAVVTRREKPLWAMPENREWRAWLPRAQAYVAVAAAMVGVRIALFAPSIWERLASPLAVLLLAPAFALLARIAVRPERAAMRVLAAAFVALAQAALAWAAPDPSDPWAWLHRNGWLFVALTFAAIVGSETAARAGENWRQAVRTVAGWAAVGAFVVLCVNLLQQVPAFDPKLRRTPLTQAEAFAMLLAVAGLFALALRFALKPDRDPLALPERGRTGYVYLAEVLIVLFFTQVRFNVPELFLKPELVKLWTFAVMALAYVGIGLAELFERKKIAVLALPLRRTGVLLPLVPLIAFWAKPPAFVNEFATGSAPGLVPFLNYLKNLPQHFDTYAWLWFLAGGVYGLVALSRKSFGWGLLAALATNAAMWSLLAHHEVPFAVHPQAWVIPLALIVLVSEHINRHRLSPEVSNGMRYGGVAMIYVASAADMFLAGVGNSMWLPVILAVLCVAGVLGGILLRVRAFVYLGVGFLLLDIFSMIWHAAVNLQQTWVWYASGIVLGVVVLALFAYLEKRRTHAQESGE